MDNKIKFKDLKLGQVFISEQNNLYMKTEKVTLADEDNSVVNCVNLEDGLLYIFLDEEEVYLYNIGEISTTISKSITNKKSKPKVKGIPKINHYKLKDNITIQDILDKGFEKSEHLSYVFKDSVYGKCYSVTKGGIDIDITFPEVLSKWNDYEYILVMDSNFAEPYTPFYGAMHSEDSLNIIYPRTDFLNNLIREYNNVMDNLGLFEKIGD